MTPTTGKSSAGPNTEPSPSPSDIFLEKPLEIAVALVEPRIPQNTGNIARLCACTGAELYLIGNLGFQLGDKYLERAGMDYLDDIEIHHLPDFNDLLALKPGWTPYYFSTKAKHNYTAIQFPRKSILVFGSETQGLPPWVVERYPEQSLRIPMRANTRSLNLSNSVAIVLYEVVRQEQIGIRPESPPDFSQGAPA